MSTTAGPPSVPADRTVAHARASASARIVRSALLACGILAALIFAAAGVLGALRWDGYSSASRSISELSATGAPSRSLVAPLLLAHNLLLIAFGSGVWRTAGRRRGLRVAGALLIASAVVGLAAPFFPIHLRGAPGTLSDAMHLVLMGVTVLLLLPAIGFAAGASGRWFRLYSIATILILIVSGTLAGLDGPRLAAQQPTPWLGVTTRVTVGAYLLWMLVLAVVLLRSRAAREAPPATSQDERVLRRAVLS